MIPSIRSLKELAITSQSRERELKGDKTNELNCIVEDSGQRKRYIRSKEEINIELPSLPKSIRHKWSKSKDSLAKFFYEPVYDNQSNSSYDLTLIARQDALNYRDVA